MLRGDSEGTTALLGLLMATGLFAVTFAAVVHVSYQPREDVPQAEQAAEGSVAANIADLILGNPGAGWYNGAACQSGTKALDTTKFQPDSLKRFGLAEERCAIQGDARSSILNLSYDKIQNLYRANLTAKSTNGLVDYAEARKSLSLDTEFLDFHLRSYPVLPGVQRILQTGFKDPFMRPLYIGDYTAVGGGGGAKMVQHSTSTTDTADTVTVSVSITNNGTVNTIFGVEFSIPLKSNNVDFTLHTKELAPTNSQTVSFKLRKTSDWEWNDPANNKKIHYEISDKDGGFQSGNIDLSSITMTHASTRENLFAEADKLWFKKSGSDVEVKFHYASYDGKGKLDNFDDWTYKLINPSGGTEATWVLPSNKDKGDEKKDVSTLGTYTASLENDALTSVWNNDTVNVVSADPQPFTTGGSWTYTPGPSTAPEAAYIDYLVQNFDAKVFSNTYGHPSVPYAAEGDIFPDLKTVMDNDLKDALTNSNGVATLDDYNVVFVGTSTDHQAMTSQAAKGTIRDWVLAGGTLIVFGSADQSVTWLQPLFHSALTSTSSGISIPDENHPVLTTPNDLDATSFDPHGTAWDFGREEDRASFTHVVTAGSDDILAVSNPGAYGDGRILLTSWQPYDLTYGTPPAECQPATLQANCAGLLLVDNFLTLAYRGLYLDYGPTIPVDAAQGVQSRIAVVWHPELKKHVELMVLVFVFG